MVPEIDTESWTRARKGISVTVAGRLVLVGQIHRDNTVRVLLSGWCLVWVLIFCVKRWYRDFAFKSCAKSECQIVIGWSTTNCGVWGVDSEEVGNNCKPALPLAWSITNWVISLLVHGDSKVHRWDEPTAEAHLSSFRTSSWDICGCSGQVWGCIPLWTSIADVRFCRVLAEMLAPHRKKGKAPPRTSLETNRTSTDEEKGEQSMVVLPSSTELFYFYGQSLDQCAKLSTGQAFFDLCNLHKKWLRIYAGAFRQLLVIRQNPYGKKIRGCIVIQLF